ncbi:DUF6086 family protein [Amycolatopsis sp. WGS_07]|uniref:DUF6086 family protein n=1 Tax=Amycolatopsis sp. WGS_07 TaxID=3076764 RepID=UPI003872D4C7
MSYVFDAGGETVWSPSLRMGKLFVSMAETLASNFDLDLPSAGFTAMASDYYYLDPPRLAAFVRTLLGSSVASHPVYWQLARGFLAICLVLLEECGVTVDGVPAELAEARDSLPELPK